VRLLVAEKARLRLELALSGRPRLICSTHGTGGQFSFLVYITWIIERWGVVHQFDNCLQIDGLRIEGLLQCAIQIVASADAPGGVCADTGR
jgi:hypothetical protein